MSNKVNDWPKEEQNAICTQREEKKKNEKERNGISEEID